MNVLINSSILVRTAKKCVIAISNYLQEPGSRIKYIIKESYIYSMYKNLCKLALKRPAAEYSVTFSVIYKFIYFIKKKLEVVIKFSNKYFEESIIGKFVRSFKHNPLSSFYIFAGTTFFVMSFMYIIIITARIIARQQAFSEKLYVVPLIAGLSGFLISYWYNRFEAALQGSFVVNFVRKFINELIKL